MHFFELNEITRALYDIKRELHNFSNNPLQLITVMVAFLVGIFSPWASEWFRRRPRKSGLTAVCPDIKKQYNDDDEDTGAIRKLLHVGRIVIENQGKYTANSVEAYLDTVEDADGKRENFLPVPLVWTHGQLNGGGSPTIRNIYPGQKVYLDVFNNIYDDEVVGERIVAFAILAGNNITEFSRLALLESKLAIKLYQESGQVNQITLKIDWNGVDVPVMSIVGQEAIK